ncbi:MAG: flagellar export chaperone FlgN [Nitrospira sp.]
MLNTSTPLDQLNHILTREFHQCDLLAQNIVQERDAIKRMALPEFLSINQVRVGILECLGALKEEFDDCVTTLATIYQVPEANRTVTEILHRVQSPQGGVILQQYERLAEKVRAVKQDIQVNQILINHVQSFLMRAAEAHREGAKEEDLYSATGVRGSMAGQAVLIRRKG